MIRTQEALIQAMKKDLTMRMYWRCGEKPSHNGTYHVEIDGLHTTVHGNAANAAINAGAVKAIRRDWSNATYRLSFAIRHAE